jgi:uncharacterized DUF497 family protein
MSRWRSSSIPRRNAANIARHGISLAGAAELEMLAVKLDCRFEYRELRYRAWGLIEGRAFCLAFTTRDGRVRAISLRRVHRKLVRNVP